MSVVYAGIGSRQTPFDVLRLMARIARECAAAGGVLRSGAADGADAAFERGAVEAGGATEIYLPWRRYNSHASPLFHVDRAALDLAARFHPAWSRCSPAAQKLHARNGYQVLGRSLDAPADVVICWTPGGTGSGGTGQAIRIARARGIPVHDLGRPEVLARYIERLG